MRHLRRRHPTSLHREASQQKDKSTQKEVIVHQFSARENEIKVHKGHDTAPKPSRFVVFAIQILNEDESAYV